MSQKTNGDGGIATQKRRAVPLPDIVRGRKYSSTPIASDTTATKGASDKSIKMIRCGMHFRNTQMGPYNGFPSRL